MNWIYTDYIYIYVYVYKVYNYRSVCQITVSKVHGTKNELK